VFGALPKRYIGSDKHRMEAYRRLSRAASLEQLGEVVKSLTEAFGEPPPPAQLLIDLTEIRIAASTHRIAALKLEGPDLIVTSHKLKAVEPLFAGAPGRVSVLDDQTLYYRPPANYLDPATLLAVLRKLLVRPIEAAARSPEAEPAQAASAAPPRA